jgi:PAS domain S-box-containing protein
VTDDRDQQLPASLHRFVAGWAIAGIGTVAAALLVVGERGVTEAPTPVAAVALLAACVVACLSAVLVRTSESVQRVSFIEVPIVAGLLLMPPVWVVLLGAAGIAIAEVASRRPLVKRVFNVGIFVAATGAATLLTVVLRGGAAPLGLRGLVAVAVGMVAFGAVNAAAMRGLTSELRHGRVTRDHEEQARTSLLRLSLVGNTAAGMLAAVLITVEPWFLVLLVVPLGVLYYAGSSLGHSSALLRRSEAERSRLHRIVEGVNDGVAFLDRRGEVELWSPSMERLTGVPGAGALGVSLEDLLHVEGLDGRRIVPVEAVASATPDSPEVVVPGRLLRPDGIHRDVSLHLTVLFETLRAEGTVVLLRDVTRERELERAKDDFLMRISHELRTPLTPIRGYAESLRTHRDLVTPELLERSLERIEDRAEHMTRLVDDLLLVANLGTGDARVASTDVRVVDRVEDVVQRASASHDGREVEVAVDPSHVAFADGARLAQIVAVLVDNALRYSAPGSPVVVRSTERDDRVVVEVQDHGRGIPPDHAERIFDRFHRVEDPLVMTTAGVGVGLYLARRLADSMGGELTCRSEVGQGSTFRLAVPIGRTARRPREPGDVTVVDAREEQGAESR